MELPIILNLRRENCRRLFFQLLRILDLLLLLLFVRKRFLAVDDDERLKVNFGLIFHGLLDGFIPKLEPILVDLGPLTELDFVAF